MSKQNQIAIANISQNSAIQYWIGFTKIPSIGPIRFEKIQKHFPSLEQAWNAPAAEFKRIGFSDIVVADIEKIRNTINLSQELEKIQQAGASVVTIEDKAYPHLLKETYAPPPLLYYRGALPSKDPFLIAVVGSRKFSQYGAQVTNTLVHDLAHSGITIVSGLALGIDALAHHAALEAGGVTIAVLGGGTDDKSVYPRANQGLAEKIIEHNGCILSEHGPGTVALNHHFPRRNRIISGMSLGTIIVEAAQKSGALITAQYALEQNREIFAVPGNITSPNSSGANNLLKMGARVVTDASDVLQLLNLEQAETYQAVQTIVPDSKEEALLLEHLGHEPIHIDRLARLTKLSIQAINATLTLMEMKGIVRHLGSMNYIRAR